MQNHMNLIIPYIQEHHDCIIHDLSDFIQIKFKDLSEIDSKLPKFLDDFAYVSLTISYYSQTFKSIHSFDKELLETFSNQIDSSAGIITVTIDKKKLIKSINCSLENTYVYMNMDNFSQDIINVKFENNKCKLNLFLIEKGFNKLDNNFICIQDIDCLDQSMLNTNIDDESICTYNLLKEIYLSKTVDCYTKIPHFWSFGELKDNLKTCKKNCTLSFFNLISNKTLSQNKKYLIKGHHNLTLNIILEDDFNISTQQLVELIDFTLDADRYFDKILILRNVITRYLNNHSGIKHFSKQLDHIIDTANHDFELYIQNEIKVFIDQKNHLLNETLDVTKGVSKQTQSASENIRSLTLTLLGAIIAGSVSTIADLPNNILFLSLFVIVIIFYLSINLFISNNIKKQHENNLNALKNYVETISNTSLKGLDYNSLKIKFIDPEESSLFTTLLIYNIICLLLIFLSLVFLLYINNMWGLNFYN